MSVQDRVGAPGTNILVLGGCGFIGSFIVDQLVAAGHRVSVFDRSPERFRPPVQGVRYHFGDFSDRMAVFEALAGAEVVFHLISTSFPGTANLDPRADVTGNLIGTLNLCDAMVSLGTPRLVYLSSGGTVYGRPQCEQITEDHPLRPINSYGIVKVAIEHYLEFYRTVHGLKTIAIRAANPYGPRQGHTGVQGVISTFMRALRDGRTIEIWGDGSVVRDYLYVGDLADLCVRAAQTDLIGSINAGSGVGRSLTDIVAALANVTGKRIEPVFKPGRAVDVARSVLDITRARQELGWSPVTEFSQGLQETWDWIQACDE